MARAKITKKKRRKIRWDRIACLLCLLSVVCFVGTKTIVKSYNYSLSKEVSNINKKVKTMQADVKSLETEINKLQSRDRVLSMVKKDGIKNNADQIVVIEDTKKQGKK